MQRNTNKWQALQIPYAHMARFRPFHVLQSHDVNVLAGADHDAVFKCDIFGGKLSWQLSHHKRPKGAFGWNFEKSDMKRMLYNWCQGIADLTQVSRDRVSPFPPPSNSVAFVRVASLLRARSKLLPAVRARLQITSTLSNCQSESSAPPRELPAPMRKAINGLLSFNDFVSSEPRNLI